VAFPTPPSYQLVPGASGGAGTQLWTAKAGGVEYNLTCSCTAVSREQAREIFVGDALTRMYDKGIDASLRSVSGKLVSREDIKVAGLRGVEFVIEPGIAAGKLFARLLQVDNCSVGISIHAPAGDRTEAVTAALESLRLK
jgi:hypothetical protein